MRATKWDAKAIDANGADVPVSIRQTGVGRYEAAVNLAGRDRVNLSLRDTRGGLLLVPQFTLAADTDTGMRPSFGSAAPPEQGRALFERATTRARSQLGDRVASGQFGAHMQVRLTNDGPVTFWLRVPPVEGKL